MQGDDRGKGSARRRPWRQLGRFGLVAAAGALVVAACGSTKPSSAAKTTITKAVPAANIVSNATIYIPKKISDYPPVIVPFTASGCNVYPYFNVNLWLNTYYYGYEGKPVVNPVLSLAKSTNFLDGGRKVEITLKNWNWSNGKPITADNILLWVRLLQLAEKPCGENFSGTNADEFPANIVASKVVSTKTIEFTLNHSYNPQYLTYDEFYNLIPIPLEWGRETMNGPEVNPATMTAAQADGIVKFLVAQAKDTATYDTNPLWKIVDGGWVLKSWVPQGKIVFVRNPAFGGPKQDIGTVVIEPVTTHLAEFDAARSGNAHYTTVTLPASLAPRSTSAPNPLGPEGYVLKSTPPWGFASMEINLNNPTMGPVFRQLYARQAIEQAIDQRLIIDKVFGGLGVPGYSYVPADPRTFWVSKDELHPVYPFDPAKAEARLRDHGWKVVPGGVDTCQKPGTGSGECGAGVKAGQPFSFSLVYAPGTVIDTEMEVIKTELAKIGISVSLRTGTFDTIVSDDLGPCSPGQSGCSNAWQASDFGGVFSFGPDPGAFGTVGCGNTATNYCSKKMDKIALAVHFSSGSEVAAVHAVENYAAEQLPYIFLPLDTAPTYEISKHLGGFEYEPGEAAGAGYYGWYITK